MNNKISRGNDVKGLVRYLMGPGRAEEHRDQRVIAAGPGVVTAIGEAMSEDDVASLGFELDLPRVLHGTKVMQKVRQADGSYVPTEQSVWHLSLSNGAGDTPLSDAQWAEIANDVMDRMGFSAAGGHAPCPWVAIAHGPSTNGNEHVHLAVSLVREDGRVASTWQDQVKMSQACAAYEQRYGLRVVQGRQNGSCAQVHRPEVEASQRRGRHEPERASLARSVRASAVASRDEAEFVRRLRDQGVLVRPYYASGSGRSVVAGYSVALRPPEGSQPVWYGGGHLARDLRLPALRAGWESTEDDRRTAVPEWNREASRPTSSGTGSEGGGREAKQWGSGAWGEATEQLGRVCRTLSTMPLDDTAAWSTAAGDAAGVVGGLAARLEPLERGPLSRAADALADAAQTREPRPTRARSYDLAGVGAVITQAALPGGPLAWALLMNQLLRLARTIEEAHEASGAASGASAAAARARADLEDVHSHYALAGAGSGHIAGPGPVGPAGPSQRPAGGTVGDRQRRAPTVGPDGQDGRGGFER